MMRISANFGILTGVIAIAVLSAAAHSAGDSDADWPCIQRKVPTISAGMMWAGPEIDEQMVNAWRADEKVAGLVPRLAARRTDLDAADRLVAGFATELGPGERSRSLTLLFAGVLDRVNAERRDIMAGIERYARKQRALAESVGETREALAQALRTTSPSEADDKARRELEQTLEWQSRIYEERERSLTYVCESPVLLEQRAFAIARIIMSHLE